MPIGISQQPFIIGSSNNDNYYVVSSSQYVASSSAYLDYKYTADVKDASGSVLCTLKSFPDPVYKYGVFNLKNIASAFTSYDFFPDFNAASLFYTASNSYKKLQLFFGEEYILPGSSSAPFITG